MPDVFLGSDETSVPPLARIHRIDVWIFDLDCPDCELTGLSRLLSSNERARFSRFKNPLIANRWTVAHARLRQIVGSYLEATPYQDEFVLNFYGKPRIPSSSIVTPLNFSLSHSGQVGGVAVCVSGEIGLDIETIGNPPWEIEPDVFNDAERQQLNSYADAERRLAFYRGWTRKEAVIKAMGLGLSIPLHDVEVDLGKTQTRLRRLAGNQNPDWRVVGLEEYECWVGAVAMRTAGAAIDVQLRDIGSHFGTQIA